jgi:ferredoxin-NADP reductase
VRFDAPTLARIVPDIAARDVYVCGPAGFSSEVARIARRLRVSSEQIHIEAFGF